MRIIVKVLNKYLARDGSGNTPKLPSKGCLPLVHTCKRITKTRLILSKDSIRTLVFTLTREGVPIDKTELSNKADMNIMFIPKNANPPAGMNPHVWESMESCYLCKNITNHFYLSTTEISERVTVVSSDDFDPFMSVITTSVLTNILSGEDTMEKTRLNLRESTDITL